MNNIRTISLDDWNLFREKRNSSNYLSKDEKYVLKVVSKFSNVTLEQLNKEKDISKHLLKAGIPTPEVVEVVKVGEDLGIIYKAIENKVSISRAIYRYQNEKENYITRFAKFSKYVHSCTLDTSFFESFSSRVVRGLKKIDFLSKNQKQFILDKLKEYPDTNTCLFLDFQYSNVVCASDKSFAIDIGTFCYGDSIFDLAFLYCFTYRLADKARINVLHMDNITADTCFNIFLKQYFPELDEIALNKKKEELSTLSVISYIAISAVLNVNDHIKGVLLPFFDKEVHIA